jgi:hypothetical protein
MRCDSCRLEGYGTTHRAVQLPPSPTAASSKPLLSTLELSKETTEKLANIGQLKTVYKATFDEAAKKHEQGSFTPASGSGKSPLERYLHDLIRPSEFVFAWEWSILPFLVEIIPKFLGRGFAINVTRNPRKNSAQTICFTSKLKSTRTRRMMIARS